MGMKEALCAKLLADGGVAALVGTRVYWARRAQGSALPAVVMFKIAGGDVYTLGGRAGICDSLVQINCLGATYTAADALASAVRTVLSGLRDDDFSGVFIEGERDTDDGQDPGSVFQTSLDCRVWTTA